MKKILLSSFVLFNVLASSAYAADFNCDVGDTCNITANNTYDNLSSYGTVIVSDNVHLFSNNANFYSGANIILSDSSMFFSQNLYIDGDTVINFSGSNSLLNTTTFEIQNGQSSIINSSISNIIANAHYNATSNMSRVEIVNGDLTFINMTNDAITNIYLGDEDNEGAINFTDLVNNHRLRFYINNGDSKINGNLNGDIYVYINDLAVNYGYMTSTSSSSLFENTTFTGTNEFNLSIEEDNEFVYDGGMARNIDNLRVKYGANATLENNMTVNETVLVVSGGALFLNDNELTVNDTADIEDDSVLVSLITSPTEYGKITTDTMMISRNAILNLAIYDDTVLPKGETMRLDLITANSFVEDDDYGTNFETIITGLRYKVDLISAGVYDLTHLKDAYDMAYDLGGGRTEAEVGRALIDTGYVGAGYPLQPIFNNVNELSKTTGREREFVQALNTLAPDSAPLIQSNTVGGIGEVMRAISNRFDMGKVYATAGNKGMASGDKTVGKSAVWAQMLYNETDLKDRGSVKGFNGKSSGLAIGFETNPNDKFKIGLGFNYIDTEIDSDLRRNDVDNYGAFAYLKYQMPYLFNETSFSYGFSRYAEKKDCRWRSCICKI